MPKSTTTAGTIRILDTFCCQGGAARGLYEHFSTVYEHVEITGVDLEPQPRYPYRFIQGDAIAYITEHGADYDFIWASPPCQAYTIMLGTRETEHPELVLPTRRALAATGKPYIIENVPGAPLYKPVRLCGAMFGLRTYRHRLFECSFPVLAPKHPLHPVKTIALNDDMATKRRLWGAGWNVTVAGHCSVEMATIAMQIDWMDQHGLAQAVPPAYSRYLASWVRPLPRPQPLALVG